MDEGVVEEKPIFDDVASFEVLCRGSRGLVPTDGEFFQHSFVLILRAFLQFASSVSSICFLWFRDWTFSSSALMKNCVLD